MPAAAVEGRSTMSSFTPHHNPKPCAAEEEEKPPFNFNALGGAPSRSSRPRPRLVKQRKQHARSRATGENGPEVNPFCSFSFPNGEDFVFGAKSSLGNNNNNVHSNKDDGDGDDDDDSFVKEIDFLGNKDRFVRCNETSQNAEGAAAAAAADFVSTLNLGQREYSDNVGKSGCDAVASSKNGNQDEGSLDFVFGSRWFSSTSTLNSGINYSCGNSVPGTETEFDQVKANSFHSHAGGVEVKSGDESLTDSNTNSNSQNHSLTSEFTSKCKLVFETSNSIASEATCGDSNETSDRPVFGSQSNMDDTNIGISSSKPFTFQAGLGAQINKPHAPSASCSFSSVGLGFKVNGCASQPPSAGGVKTKQESRFTSTQDGFGVHFEDLKTPLRFAENLFPQFNGSDFSVKGRSVRDKRSRKTRGNPKKPSVTKKFPGQDHVSKESTSQETPVSSKSYSPMDFSPYGENRVADSHSRGTSATSNDSFHLASNNTPCAYDASVPIEPNSEDFATPEGEFDDKDDHTPCFTSKESKEEVGADIGVNKESKENLERDCGTHRFASDFGNIEGKAFTFMASSSAECSPIMAKRRLRRVKNKMKVGHNAFVISASPSLNIHLGGSDQPTPHSSTPFFFDAVGKSDAHEQVREVNIPSTNITHETCENWRLRGNKAYENGEFRKAEELYTQGIVSVPSSERSGCCLDPLLRCYSNRAAARKHLGRIREALGDCMMATVLDHSFLKVQMRAANFHLLLGEVENALQYFNKCLESGTAVCLDRRSAVDSADGIQKAQKVVEYTNRAAKLLEHRTTDAALSALEIISEALSISEYSEKLLEMKAEALCLLRRYEDVIQLCEDSLYFAEKNFSSLSNVVNLGGAGSENYPFARLWRWSFISKSYFHLGRFDAALDLLEKLEKVGSTKDRYASKILESSIALAVTIRELLRHKDLGNEAFRSGRHAEAVEHYTVALSCNFGSRPFSAICLCNRAAAHQALGQIADAISDCSLAIALEGNYIKAVSRSATLHEMIRDYGQAASDLQRLISILENQSGGKGSTSQGSSNGRAQELRHAYQRIPLMEEEAKKGIPLNFYLILGVNQSDTSSDIKKAYRKAALKHHPDKAGQFLARSESGDDKLWKEISVEVHKDADRLFKIIGEAYAVLSDPNKRSEYDLEEDMRKAAKERKERSSYRKSSNVQSPRRSSYRKPDFNSSPFERNYNCRNGRESWKTQEDSYSRKDT